MIATDVQLISQRPPVRTVMNMCHLCAGSTRLKSWMCWHRQQYARTRSLESRFCEAILAAAESARASTPQLPLTSAYASVTICSRTA
jgi:hypothetical protein